MLSSPTTSSPLANKRCARWKPIKPAVPVTSIFMLSSFSSFYLFTYSVVRLFGCSVVRLFGCSVVRLFGCSVATIVRGAQMHASIHGERPGIMKQHTPDANDGQRLH